MNYPQEMGNLISLYVDEIEINNPCDLPEFPIKASAKILNQQGGINWIPVIVKQIGESQYEVIGNSFIFAIALEAGLERVWCIVADDSDQTTELSQILAREKTPKINLSKASRDEIKSALEYLIEKPDNINEVQSLENETLKNLRVIAKERGIKGFSKMKKGDLIKILATKS